MLLTLLLDPTWNGLEVPIYTTFFIFCGGLIWLMVYLGNGYRRYSKEQQRLATSTAEEVRAYSERSKKRVRLVAVIVLVLVIIAMYQG
jgi:hypothetical protein